MAVRTIGVKITGKDDVKKLQKEVKKLQDAVALVEKSIVKVGGSKSPTFSVKVKLNSSEFNEQYKKLKQKYSEKKITFKSSLNTKGVSEDFKALKDKMHAQSIKILVNTSSTKKDARNTLTAMRSALSDFEVKAKVGVDKTYFRASVLSLKKILDQFEMNLKVKVKSPTLPKQTQKVEVIETKRVQTTPTKKETSTTQTQEVKLDTSNAVKSANELKRTLSSVSSLAFSNALVNIVDNIHDRLMKTVDASNKLYKTLIKLSLVDPMRQTLRGVSALSSQVLRLNSQLENMVRTTILNHMQNAFYTVANSVRNVFASVVEETKEIGDSLVTYKLQMEQVGHSQQRINLDLKDLTEYGKKTVYDASDLIQQAGNYTAYGRDDSIELVKALAGLSAHTKNPNESLEHIGLQLNDVLARQKVTWQDVRIMKTWFNAQGSKAIQDILQEQAERQGYSSVGDAMKDNIYTVDDLVNAIKQVGNDPSFQQMVATIATPVQALENLKENLSNLFIVPDYNDDGSVTDAPLQKTYDSITNFIKAISSAVDDNRLKMGVRAISGDLSKFIDSITRTGNELKKFKVTPLLNSFKQLREEFQKNKKQADVVSKGILKITNTMINFNKKAGRLGESLPKLFNSIVDAVDGYTRVFAEAIDKGAVNAISSLFDIYANLANLSVDTGAVELLSDFYQESYTLVNEVLTSPSNVSQARRVVVSLGDFASNLLEMVRTFTVEANAVGYISSIITTIVDGITSIVKYVNSSVGANGYEKIFANILGIVKSIVDSLKSVYSMVISSVLKYAGSGAFKVLADTIIQLLSNVNRIFVAVITQLGGGSFENGLKTISNALTMFLQVIVNITDFLAQHPTIATVLVGAISYLKLIRPFMQELFSVIEMFRNAKTPGGKLSYILGTSGKATKTQAMAGVATEAGAGLAGTAKLAKGVKASEEVAIAAKTIDSGIDAINAYGRYIHSMQELELASKEATKLGKVGIAAQKGLAKATYTLSPLQRTLTNITSKLKSGAKMTTTMFKGMGDAFYSSTGIIDGIKSANVARKSSDLAKTVGEFAKGTSTASKAFRVGTSAIKGIAPLVGGELLDRYNNSVQNSNASKGVKTAFDYGNAGAQGALIGAGLGSFVPGLGTVAGAVIGGIGGMALKNWTKNLQKQEKEAEKAIQKQINEQETQEGRDMAQALSDHFAQLGQVATEARRSFSKAIINDDDEQALQDSISYLNELSQSSSTSISQQLRQLGMNAQAVPQGIDDMYVELNGQLVKWTDLKKQTGLNDEELLGALELVDSAQGKYITYLRDQYGNITAAIQNKTDSAQQRDQQQITNFIDAVNKRGIAIGNLDNATLTDIDAVTQTLEDAINGSYYTVEDKKQALASALANGDEALYNQYMTYKVEDLQNLVQSAIDASKENTGSAESIKAELINKYKDVTDLTGKSLKNKVKEMVDMTVEELQQEVQEAEANRVKKDAIKDGKVNLKDRVSLVNLSGMLGQLDENIKGMTDKIINDNAQEIDVAIANLQGSDAYGQNVGETTIRDILSEIGIKDKELQSRIIAKIQGGSDTLQEAINSVQADITGDMEATKEQLGARSQALFNSVLEKINNGSLTLDQGIQILSDANVDPALISTEGLGTSAQGLYDGVATKNTETEGKLQEMAGKVNEKNASGIDTSPISTALSNLWGAIQSLGNWASEQISNIGESVSKAWNNLTGNGKQAKKAKKSSSHKWTGGVVEAYRQAGGRIKQARIKPEYHATGDIIGGIDWKPRGTDTVPTMLTKGEYVLRKKAVDSLGTVFLDKLNTQGAKALETITNNRQVVYNNYYNNNANVTQNIDNKSQYLNGIDGLDRLMRYV